MDIIDENDKNKKKIQMPSVGKILNAINQRGLFSRFQRYRYTEYDLQDAMKIVEAIGKSRDPKFVIDNENRFTYENFVKWCHGDSTMQCMNPVTHQPCPGNLKRGIYIAGNTGTGKTWCLDIMLAYCAAFNFRIMFMEDTTPRPLWWKTVRADAICDQYAETGDVQDFKKQKILGIQDLGSESSEILYMGNRQDVIRNLIEYRGDMTDEITMITSNLKINGDVMKNRYGDRVASRLVEMCNYFEISGKDRRRS